MSDYVLIKINPAGDARMVRFLFIITLAAGFAYAAAWKDCCNAAGPMTHVPDMHRISDLEQQVVSVAVEISRAGLMVNVTMDGMR